MFLRIVSNAYIEVKHNNVNTPLDISATSLLPYAQPSQSAVQRGNTEEPGYLESHQHCMGFRLESNRSRTLLHGLHGVLDLMDAALEHRH